jgi:hypothetical protein
VLLNACIHFAKAVGAVQKKCVASGILMSLAEENLRQSSLIDVPKLEGHITELNCSVCANPYHLVGVAGNAHGSALQ